MKHWFKKSAAIAMSAVMALSLAACASSKPATPEEVLQAASEKVSAAKSMTCETTTQMKMSAGGQSIQMTMTGELETTMDPVAMHMDMTTDMGAMGSMNVKMYMGPIPSTPAWTMAAETSPGLPRPWRMWTS